MKPDTCLVVDIWEGQQKVDFQVLKNNGVSAVSIRINDMNGGHHVDTEFKQHWENSRNIMIRFPYFVYNPWVSAYENYQWLVNNMPADAKVVALDVEVAYAGISAKKYAGDLVSLIDLCKLKGWKVIIYTADWFLNNLSSWPKLDYWWAQYPTGDVYFKGINTWDALKAKMDTLDKPFNSTHVPGFLKMWQFSGDYLTLPGSDRKMDVNIFYGTEQELNDYFGGVTPVPIPPANFVPSNLYTFSPVNYFERPGGGPLTLPMTRSAGKLGDNILRYNWSQLLPVIKRLNPNNPNAAGLIAAPDWGPSKGLDGEFIRWIGLLWPGRNVVRIDEVSDGWGKVTGVELGVSAYLINANDHPQLVHMVYDYNRTSGYGERKTPVYVPIMSGPWWVDMTKLISVDAQLPKIVKIKSFLGLRVRKDASINATPVKTLFYGTNVIVESVRIGTGGIWGKTTDGWIALRANDVNYTDWKI